MGFPYYIRGAYARARADTQLHPSVAKELWESDACHLGNDAIHAECAKGRPAVLMLVFESSDTTTDTLYGRLSLGDQ